MLNWRKSSRIHAQSLSGTQTFLGVFKWMGSEASTMKSVRIEPAVTGNNGNWENLQQFTLCYLLSSWCAVLALAKFSRKPSTNYCLGVQGTSLISPNDLDKSEAWKQGNPDVSLKVERWGPPHIFRTLSRLVTECLPPLLPGAIWRAFLVLGALAQWPSASACCCFWSPSGPQGFWPKALSEFKVGF